MQFAFYDDIVSSFREMMPSHRVKWASAFVRNHYILLNGILSKRDKEINKTLKRFPLI